MSKDIIHISVNSARKWYQPGRDQREIVAGVIVDGEARWLKAQVRHGYVNFSEAFLIDPRSQLRQRAKAEIVRRAEEELPGFAAGRSP